MGQPFVEWVGMAVFIHHPPRAQLNGANSKTLKVKTSRNVCWHSTKLLFNANENSFDEYEAGAYYLPAGTNAEKRNTDINFS